MDLRHLVTFRTVVDKGSFSQAAEELEVSQPAVSFQIRSLEERLGQRLLDRSGRRVSVTEAGEVVYRYARRMIGLEAELEREMGEIGTRIALGASERDIVWMVIREGGLMAVAGLASGLAIGWLAAQSLSSMLHGVTPSDPRTLAGSVALLAAASLVACYLPARRAARLDAAKTLAESS